MRNVRYVFVLGNRADIVQRIPVSGSKGDYGYDNHYARIEVREAEHGR
jgi:hypothetical protein